MNVSGDIMKILLKKENVKLLLSAIIYLVLGVLFCVFLGQMVDFAETAICFVFLVVGAVLLVVYGLLPADGKIYQVLIYGIVGLVLGLLILMVRMFFIIALSALIAYGGIQSIMNSVKLKKQGEKWKGELIVGSVIVALAIVVIILNGTSTARNIIAIFLGVTFLIETAFEIYAIVKLLMLEKAKAKELQGTAEIQETQETQEVQITEQTQEVQVAQEPVNEETK